MLQKFPLVSGVGLAILLTAGGSGAAELATRSTVQDLQKAERLIAVAIRVGDLGEMKRQSHDLLRLFSGISETEESPTKVYCTSAIQNLLNLADDLSYPDQAAKILAADNSHRRYLQYVERCEAEVGLPAPAGPNLRSK